MDENKLQAAIIKEERIGPEKVMLSLTDACNLGCKFCWRLAKKNRASNELNITEIKNVLKDCKKLGVKTIDCTGGGEPFFRKDIFNVLKLVKDYVVEATLTTNGTLLTEADAKKLIDLKLDDICFSLESHDKKINDSIRGSGVFDKVVKSIKLLNKLKQQYGSKLPKVRLATVITKANYMELDKLVDFAADLSIEAINFSTLIEWNTNKPLWLRKENPKKIKKSLEKAQEKILTRKINSNLSSLLEHGLFEHNPPKFCFAPWSMIFINADGDAMVCCTLASLYQNPVGNVKKQSLQEIWFGPKMNEFRKKIKAGEFSKDCKRCIPEFTDNYNQLYEKMKTSCD